jgi:hypothetical protein
VRGPNQILFDAVSGRDSFSRKHKTLTKIRLTPYSVEDLDLELEFGLSIMQTGRILRLIEEAYRQDALLCAKQLTLLCNITPTSLRGRLAGLRREGIWAPVAGLSRADREQGGELRSAWSLARYLDGAPLVEVRQTAALSREAFRHLWSRFSHVAHLILNGGFRQGDPEEEAWAAIAQAVPKKTLLSMLEDPGIPPSLGDWASFKNELLVDFSLSPVKVTAIRDIAGEMLGALADSRPDGDVVYWAVSSTEPAGKPLDACRLAPVSLTLYDIQDVPAPDVDCDINRLSDIKFRKVLRYATQAKYAGGYLTYADLGHLLGIHPEAISRLVRSNPTVAVPLRGAECDIGRGVTHRQKIIQLYLEMHTETEIVARTGHSYEAIENYIKEFATILVLFERGLTAPLIRRVTGRSIKLIYAYLELIEEYSGPEYAFRFHHLRRVFQMHEDELKKTQREVKR